MNLCRVDGELQNLLQGTSTLQNTESYANREKDLHKNLERFRQEFITSKEKKIIRNRKAFQLNRAYKWPTFLQQKSFRYLNPPKNTSNSRSRDTTDSESFCFLCFFSIISPCLTQQDSQTLSEEITGRRLFQQCPGHKGTLRSLFLLLLPRWWIHLTLHEVHNFLNLLHQLLDVK